MTTELNGSVRRILVTGADGFIGKNLVVRLKEFSTLSVLTFVRGDDTSILPKLMSEVDAVIHLAGENRPNDEFAFTKVNVLFTTVLCDAIREEFRSTGRKVVLIFTSTLQVENDSPYGRSKLAAELVVEKLANEIRNPCVIFRLPGVFGKWCKPNYNSVVATLCHNIIRGLPIQIHDPNIRLKLVYVDDVVTALLRALDVTYSGCVHYRVEPECFITLGDLVTQIRVFDSSCSSQIIERVGTGFLRALYATYLSYLPVEKFSYQLAQHIDSRGVFVEVLKTQDSGQFSYFIALPGVTRGGHYHHTKSESFLVIRGKALFRFRHLVSNELVELLVSDNRPEMVVSVPGWIHDITNVGDDEMIVMLWANENFDPLAPDTVARGI